MTRRQPNPSVACQVARESISALVDDEELPIPEPVVTTHLSQCKRCSDFKARVVSLTREMSVRAVPEPDCTTEMLTSLGLSGGALSTCAVREPAWAHRRGLSFARATQWIVGLAPLVVALPALALGVFAHTHIVPSHELAPCMMSLAHHRR